MLPEYISRNIIFSVMLSLLLVFVFWGCAFFLVELESFQIVPTSAHWLDMFQFDHPGISFFLCMVLSFLTALVWNSRLNDSEALIREEFSHLVNIVILALVIYSLGPSIQLALSIFFIVLSMNRLLTINRNSDSFHSVSFDSGLFIGLATYFSFPSLIMLVYAWIAMFILSSMSVKEFFWSIIGFSFPYLVLYLLGLIFKTDIDLFPLTYLGGFDLSLKLSYTDYAILFISIIAMFYGLLVLNQKLKRSSVRFQRLISALNMFYIAMTILAIMVSLLNDWQYIFISLVFPISYYWHCIGQTRSGWLPKSFIYLIWVGLIVFNFLFPMY